MSGAPPGWYRDPWGTAQMRWWDGFRWTDHSWTSPPPDPAFAAMQRAHLVSERQSAAGMSRWAKVAVVVFGAMVLGEIATALVALGGIRQEIHQFFHDVQTGGSSPTPPTPDMHVLTGVTIVFDVGQLLLLLVAVLFLLWQYHAATTAAALGYPAVRSPGLGVGSWFIPVVNLWFPYQALRDLLPPSHRMRRRALPAWLAYLAAWMLTAITFEVALFSGPGAVVPGVLGAAATVVAVTLGRQLIGVVEQDHRRAAEAAGLSAASR